MNIGDQLFNEDGDIFRIHNIRNKNLYITSCETTGEIGVKLREKDIKKCKLIAPIGYITFMNASIGGGHKDVIIVVHRAVDMKKNIYKPFIGMRLSMVNMFAMPFENSLERLPLGMCYSIDTCPTNVNFDIIYECEKVIDKNVVSLYMDDTIQSILPLVMNKYKYEINLQRFQNKFDPKGLKNTARNLYDFMDWNGFMSEFNHAFNILNLENYTGCPFDEIPTRDIILKMEDKIGHKITIEDIIPYSYKIDLSRLDPSRFIILRPSNLSRDLHVMKYTRGDKVLIVRNSDEKLFAQQLVSMNNQS